MPNNSGLGWFIQVAAIFDFLRENDKISDISALDQCLNFVQELKWVHNPNHSPHRFWLQWDDWYGSHLEFFFREITQLCISPQQMDIFISNKDQNELTYTRTILIDYGSRKSIHRVAIFDFSPWNSQYLQYPTDKWWYRLKTRTKLIAQTNWLLWYCFTQSWSFWHSAILDFPAQTGALGDAFAVAPWPTVSSLTMRSEWTDIVATS